MINCLIVDDEPLAREALIDLVLKHQGLSVIGECSNAIEAVQSIHQHKPDLVFLDIQMPKITGLELLSMLDPCQMPRIIFVTAYDEFAVQAFENHAFDYLLKPVDETRLAKTIERVKNDLSPQPTSILAPKTISHLPCYKATRLKIVELDDVEYVFSDLAGIHVVTSTEQVHTHLTLKVIEEKSSLIRCHRQYIVALNVISEIEVHDSGGGEIITKSARRLPVSRRYLKSLKQLFGYS